MTNITPEYQEFLKTCTLQRVFEDLGQILHYYHFVHDENKDQSVHDAEYILKLLHKSLMPFEFFQQSLNDIQAEINEITETTRLNDVENLFTFTTKETNV